MSDVMRQVGVDLVDTDLPHDIAHSEASGSLITGALDNQDRKSVV